MRGLPPVHAMRCFSIVYGLLTCLVVAVARVASAAPPEVPRDLVPPQVIRDVEIAYPEALANEDDPPAGTVVIKLTVGTDGVPHGLSVEQSVHPELDALVQEAVSRLRYRPATQGGEPIEVVLRIRVELHPPTQPEPAAEASAPEDPEPAPEPTASGPVRIAGRILEAGLRTPIAAATIVAVPADPQAELGRVRKQRYGVAEGDPAWEAGAQSDRTGKFALRDIPDGKVRVIVLAPGYERVEFIESLPPGQALQVDYYTPRLPDNPYQTRVRSDRTEREEVTRRTVDVEEIRNLPGTQGDALKAIQNFPGIARAPFGIGLLVIRGSDPTDSSVYLGEHEIPQLFHFGGLTSVFNADILTDIDFIPGNFDARYGDAIGGIVDVKTRRGRRDGVHGYIDSDLFDTGVLLEGPLGKGSFIISARRSYIDLLLPAVLPDDAGVEATLAPRYYDYQVLFDYPVSRGNLSVKVFGSDDRTRLVAADPNDISTDDRNRFETTLLFHRFDVLYENHRKGWDLLVTPSYRYDKATAGIGDLFNFTLATHTFSARAEVGRRVARRLRWDVGAQLFTGAYAIEAEAPPVPTGGGSSGTRIASETLDRFAVPSLYGTLSVGLGDRFTLYPGVRVTSYAVLIERTTFDPRLRFAWDVGESTRIKGGVGLYSQLPSIVEWNPTWGNPRLSPEQALHTSLSASHEFPHAITVEVTGFYKNLWDLAENSSELVRKDSGLVAPENFASQGRGRIYGAELFIRKALTRNAFGWISYTISRSERQPTRSSEFALFDLDQTHILTLIGVYRLPHNWQIAGRFRLVSGNPYTPITHGVFAADEGNYIPVAGPLNSQRVPMFHQLDLRLDKRFVWRKVSLTTYLDVQNVYNHQNAEFVQYSYDYSASRQIPSLPIIPSLGVKLEF